MERENYSVLAGHLPDAKISGTGEFFFYPLATKVIKTKDENAGINFYDFEKIITCISYKLLIYRADYTGFNTHDLFNPQNLRE